VLNLVVGMTDGLGYIYSWMCAHFGCVILIPAWLDADFVINILI
jgi:hypothetical protein